MQPSSVMYEVQWKVLNEGLMVPTCKRFNDKIWFGSRYNHLYSISFKFGLSVTKYLLQAFV